MPKHQFGLKNMVVAKICMEDKFYGNSEKPKISFTIATLHVPRYGELIASEKRALPTLQKELDEANRLKQDSSVTMRSKRHKLK